MQKWTNSDPHFGYSLDELLAVQTPKAPKDFNDFWANCYHSIKANNVTFTDQGSQQLYGAWRVKRVSFNSTNGFTIHGWLLEPIDCKPKRAFIVGHGYGGRSAPDYHLPFPDAVLFFPCFRGLSLSAKSPISSEPYWHVLHDIDKKDQYILRGCVEDVWLSVSALLTSYPALTGKIGFMGVSFTGGIGALAIAQDKRINRAHFNVPTFGDYRTRLRIATYGSGLAVQNFFKQHGKLLLNTLPYYDAAVAAQYIDIPTHYALALLDAFVTPPGQFAIHNAQVANKQLFVLEQGHSDYPNKHAQETALLQELHAFFQPLANGEQ